MHSQNQYRYIYYAILIASLGGFLVGYSSVLIGGALLFVKESFQLTVEQQEIVVSTSLLFAIFGSILGGICCALFGRKKAIMIAAVIFIVSSIFSFFVDRYLMILISRAMMGLGMGVASMAVPFYICEIVPANIRGSSVSLMVLEFYLGFVFAYLVNRSLTFNEGWKLTLATPMIPALGLLIGMCYMPETPQWLFGTHRQEEGMRALKRLRRSFDIDYEIELLESSSQFKSRAISTLTQKGVLKALFIGSALSVLMEISGVNAIYYYIPTLLTTKGLWLKKEAINAALYVSIISFVTAFVTMFFIDSLGRRKLLLWGTSLMIVSLVMLGFFFGNDYFYAHHHEWMHLGLFLFSIGYTFGLGSVASLMIAEIFPLKIRSFLISTVFSIKWAINFLVVRFYLNEWEFFGPPVLWIYALIGAVGVIFIYYFIPETAGASLEAIEKHWLENKSSKESME